MHHFFGWIFPCRYLKGNKRVESNKTHGWQSAKYYLMFGFLGAALAGSAIGGLFDPICVAVRAMGLGVLPALQYIGIHSSEAIAGARTCARCRARPTRARTSSRRRCGQSHQFYYHQTWLILFLLVAILFMNRFIPRFWCRALCPLGAFLGVLSRFALFGMEKDHAKCTDCNLCLVNCQGADSPQGGVKHRQDECHMCLNCESACPEDVIKFRFLPNRRSVINKPDVKRRTVLATGAAGVVAIPAMRIAELARQGLQPEGDPPAGCGGRAGVPRPLHPLRRVHEGVSEQRAASGVLRGGVEGMWTPILIPRIGYCEFSCVLCGQVCPTGAIQKIDEKQKMGIGQKPITIGTAMYDKGRCLPWSMATPCIVCEEFCPTSPKAIWAEDAEVPKRAEKPGPNGEPPKMLTVKLQRPHVDPNLCVGCGACEKVCPIVDKPAVYVTSAGETRSKTNVILLENTSYNQKS